MKRAGLLLAAAAVLSGYPALTGQSAWCQTKSAPTGAPASAPGALQRIGAAGAETSAAKMRLSQIGVPLRFEQNMGQIPGIPRGDARFIGLGPGYTVRLGPAAVAVDLPGSAPSKGTPATDRSTLSLQLAGANPQASITPEDRLLCTDSYFTGADEKDWHTGVTTYGRVAYQGVYPGIDAAFYGRAGKLEYDLIVNPGSNPGNVRLNLAGMQSIALDAAGDLRLRMSSGEVRLLKPVAYQTSADGKSRENVEVRYHLGRANRVSFTLGKYDHHRALVIDPVLDYATYLSSTYAYAIAVAADAAGDSYVAMENTAQDGFSVLKFDPNGNLLLTGTLATSGGAAAFPAGIAVSNSGVVYIVGSGARGLPTSSSSYQTNDKNTNGSLNAYFAVLTPNASAFQLTYSSYLGGVANGAYASDYGWGIAVDAQGNAYICGIASGDNFSTTAGTYQPIYETNTTSAEFVAKFNPSLSGASSLVYSTLIGGLASGNAFDAIAVDSAGDAYVAASLPNGSSIQVTQGSLNYSGTVSGQALLYVTTLNPTATALGYSAYLGPGSAFGGFETVNGIGIAVDGSGDAYVAGTTAAEDFPTTAGAYQTSYPGAFVSELNPGGTALVYSTFLGGPSSGTNLEGSEPTSIAIPAGCVSACNAYVSGMTSAGDFPGVNPIQPYMGATHSAFAVELNGTGTAAVYSTLLSGIQSTEVSVDINTIAPYTASPTAALDGLGNFYVAGNLSQALDFPVTPAPGQASPGTAYLAKIGPAVASNVVAVPSSLTFTTAQPVGVSSSIYPATPTPVLLRNMGSQAVAIDSLGLSPSDEFAETDNCNGTIAAGGFCTVNVTYTPTSDQTQTGTMTVSSGGTPLTTVALTGTGQDSPYVTVSASGLSFGDVTTGTTSAAQTVTLTNVGNAPASFSSYSLSPANSGYLVQNSCPANLQPGQSCQFSVQFAPVSAQQTNANLFITISGPQSWYYVTLTGQGVTTATGGTGTLALSSTALNFGTELIGNNAPAQSIYVTNEGAVPVSLNSVSWSLTSAQGAANDFYINASGCGNLPAQILPQESCWLSIGFIPSAAATETVTLSINDTTSSSPHTLSLTGIGIAATQTLEFEPGNMTYPDQPVGVASASQTFYVYATGTAPVTIDRVLVSGDFQITNQQSCSGMTLTGAPSPGLANGYCYVSVVFTPTATGMRTGTLTLIDSATGTPQVLSLAGNGITAVSGPPVVDPTAVVFPAQIVGTTSPDQYLTVSNPGNLPFTVNSLGITGNFAVDSNVGCGAPPAQIAAGSSCTVAVNFTPTSSTANPLTGTLTVGTTAGNQAVSLSGTGLAASRAIGFTPSSVAFGGVVNGNKSYTYPIYVRSTGTESVTFNAAPSISGPFAVVTDYCTPEGPLAAGTSCEIDLSYTPTATGAQTGSMTLSTSAGSEKLNLAGTGIANIPTASLNPGALAFTQQLINTASTQQPITLTYNGTSHLTVTSATVTTGSANFVIETGYNGCTGQQLTQNQACTVYLTFAPTVAGYDTGVVTFATSSGNYTAALSGYALSGSDTAYLSPANLVFSPQVVNTTSSYQLIQLYNTSNGSITVSQLAGVNFGSSSEFGVSVNYYGDACSGTTLTPGATCYVGIQFTPSATGSRSGTLVFPITYGDGTTGSLTAALTGSGVAQVNKAVLTPANLAFTDQVLGTTSALQVESLTNSGNVAFTVGAVAGTNYGSGQEFWVYSSNPGYDSCSGTTVQPGSSCSVYVVFTPSALGTQTGNLVFPVTYYGATSSTPLTAALSGNGVAVSNQPVLSPSIVNFATQEVGTASGSQTVTLSNTGNLPWTVGTLTGTSYGTGKVFSVYENNNGYDACSGTTVQPGSSCSIYIQFKPAAASTYSGTLVFPVTYAGATSPVNFTATLTGTGIAATQGLAFSQTTVAFGNQPVGTTSQQAQVYLVNQTPNNITVNTITLSGSNPTAYQESDNCAGTIITGNSYCTITLAFSPSSTQTGSRPATLKETDTGTGSGRVVTLSGTGTSDSPMVVFYPTSLTFGAEPLGEGSAPQNVTVTNTGVDNLIISAVASSDPTEFPVVSDGCIGQTLAQGKSCILGVVFSPTSTGTRSATISLTDNGTGSPQSFSVTGGGSAPLATSISLTANPATAPFGSLVSLSAAVVDQNSNPLTNGTVTFYNGTTLLGSAQVVRTTSGGGTIGTATLKTIALPPGADSITVKYAGADASSTLTATAVTITGTYPSTTTFASSGSAGDYTFVGTVSGAGPVLPTGNVTFNDQTTGLTLGTAAINATTVSQTFINVPQATLPNPAEFVQAVDLNGDGIPDLIIGTNNSNSGLMVQLGNGDGTFQTPQTFLSGQGVTGMAFGDFNGDGKLDMAFVANGNAGVALGNGDGTFKDEAYYDTSVGASVNLVVGDFNGDGVLDIAAINQSDGAVDLMFGIGDGTFQEPVPVTLGSGSTPTWVATADLNGDGHQDLVVGSYGNSTTQVDILLGNGNGTFQTPKTYTTQNTPQFVTLAGFRSNGKIDIVTIDNGSVGVLLGNGDGTFGSEAIVLGCCHSSAVAADVNGDGHPDLIAADSINGVVDVLPGTGTGTFGAATTYAAGSQPSSVAAADLNHDGQPDIFVANTGSNNVTVLLNQFTQTATLTGATVPGTSSTNHAVTAGYVGATPFGASTSSALQLTPTPVIPAVQLAGVPSSTVAWGQSLSVQVTMSGPLSFVPAPSGTVSYTIDNGTAQTATLANGIVTIPVSQLSVGSHTFAVTYNGDQFYTTGAQSLGLTIIKASQTITFNALSPVTYGVSPITLSATASSGLAITYKVDSGPATVSGSTLTITGAGTVVVEADQAGNADYNAATAMTQNLTVNQAPLTIAPQSTNRQYGAANPTFTGTVTGLVNGDTVTTTYSTTATVTSPVTTYPITATISGPAAANYQLTVNAGTLTVTQAPLTVNVNSASRVYGVANPTFTGTITGLLNGDIVTATYSTTATTTSTVGTYPITATLSGTAVSNYSVTVNPGTLTITKATPIITWAPPAPIVYKTPLSATQLDATANTAGTFTYTPASGTILPAGSQTLNVSFTPTDTTDYNTGSGSVTLTVNPKTPAITWATPSAITYGTALSSTQLDATAQIPGTFTYTPAIGTVLSAGSQTLRVTFTPTDNVDYTTAPASVKLTVNQAPLTATLSNATRAYKAANPTFDCTISGLVNGDTLTCTGSTTAVATSPVGTYPITATLSGTALPNYSPTIVDGTLTVTQATPIITWAAPAAITYPTPLSSTQLNATANAAGTFAYTPVSGTVLTAGSYTLSVTFTPTDTTDYTTATASVPLTVNPKVPTITWGNPAAITYPTALSATQLDATTGPAGTFVYTPAKGTVLGAGTHTLSVTFTPTDTTDYTTVSKSVTLVVEPKKPTITWGDPVAITYGTALGATQLDATTGPAGMFVYTPAAGTVLPAGTQTLSVTFTPTDTADYTTATKSVTITVKKAALAVKVANATRTYGAANPTFTSTITGLVNGDTVTVNYSTTATAASPVTSTYPISATVSGPAAANYTSTITDGTLTITKATLTVTANPQSMVYGSALPTFTDTITGFLNGDPQSVVTGAPTYSTGATSKSAVGTYTILPAIGTLAATNYGFTFVRGTLTVTPAPLTIVVNNATRVFGAANPTFSGTVTGLLNGNTVSVTYSTTATSTSPVGTYPITATIGGAYSVDYSAQVTPGTLTITASSPAPRGDR